MARFDRLLGRLFRSPAPATASAPAPAPAPVSAPAPSSASALAAAPPQDDVLRPRDLLDRGRVLLSQAVAWFRSLDKDKALHAAFEWPGAHVQWALKLGRFPLDQQVLKRDTNTMAGVLTWLFVLGALIRLAAEL